MARGYIRTPYAGAAQVSHPNSPHYVQRSDPTYIQSSHSSSSVLYLWSLPRAAQWCGLRGGYNPTCVLAAHSSAAPAPPYISLFASFCVLCAFICFPVRALPRSLEARAGLA